MKTCSFETHILTLGIWESLMLCRLLVLFNSPVEYQTVRIQLSPDLLLVLICVQTVCIGYKQLTLEGKELICHLQNQRIYNI